jgi:hypothetical protein
MTAGNRAGKLHDMKKRYVYTLLFGIPGLAVSLLVSLAVFGAMAGFLWLFVYGDDPWPRTTNQILPAVFVLTFAALWAVCLVAGYLTGKRFERSPGVNRKHILASAGATVLPVVLLMLHQFGVGNIGPKSDTALCSEFCLDRGYAGSGMPPRDSGMRTCFCLDGSGAVAVTESLESIATD